MPPGGEIVTVEYLLYSLGPTFQQIGSNAKSSIHGTCDGRFQDMPLEENWVIEACAEAPIEVDAGSRSSPQTII